MQLKSSDQIDKSVATFAGISKERKEVLATSARNTPKEKYEEFLGIVRDSGNTAEARFVESLFDDVPPAAAPAVNSGNGATPAPASAAK